MLKKIYDCEKCGKFQSEDYELVVEHEKNCNKKNIFICQKCGKTIIWHNNDPEAFEIENQCHHINLGRMGYGSMFDGSEVNFDLCDKCLKSFIDTFEFKEDIYNSGSNVCYSYDVEEESLSAHLSKEENKDWENSMINHDN